MIRSGGIFGSVREAVEIGNALMRRGHSFTFYSDQGKDLGWLPNTLTWKVTEDAATDELDVLFWSDTPDDRYYAAFQASPAKVKSFCVMGFDPAQADEVFGGGRFGSIIQDNFIIADGAWQLPYLRKYTDNLGPAVGGVNLKQFGPREALMDLQAVWSGDMRERKGGIAVMKALKGIEHEGYSKKRIRQQDLAAFICRAPIFVDGHKRGGHCNPVLEAMACGRAVVCTDTPCNSDFAINGRNCMRVPVDDHAAMRSAIDLLLRNAEVAESMSGEAIITASQYDYDKVVIPLEAAIKERL